MRTPSPQPRPALDPLPGVPVDVVIAGGWRMPVRVSLAEREGDVLLDPVGGRPVMPGEVAACPATLEWRSPRGLVRRQGQLRLVDDRLVLSGPAEAVVMQRRNFARVRAAVRVAVIGQGADGELVTRTVDLSVGGMLVENAAMLSIGERVRWVIELPGQPGIQGTGEVVRATPFGHRAVRFDPLPDGDDQRLTRYVFAQEREGRSAAAYTGA